MRFSKALNAALAEALITKEETCDDALHITTGYDNDGSTGVDMVEIGIGLGEQKQKGGPDCDVWLAEHPTDRLGWPIIARSEEEAIAIVQSW